MITYLNETASIMHTKKLVYIRIYEEERKE
jgi:hypothetical protein